MNNHTEIKEFEDACQLLGIDSKTVIPEFSFFPEKDRKSMIAHAKLVLIIKAANQLDNDGEEWTPDWDNSNEYKYEPWFKMGSSGFRYDGYGAWGTASDVGSRLCFKSREACDYITEQFIQVYKDYLL